VRESDSLTRHFMRKGMAFPCSKSIPIVYVKIKGMASIKMEDRDERKARLIALEAEIEKRFQDYVDRMPPGPHAARMHFMKAFLDWKNSHKKDSRHERPY
jgi:hypothetical protein